MFLSALLIGVSLFSQHVVYAYIVIILNLIILTVLYEMSGFCDKFAIV